MKKELFTAMSVIRKIRITGENGRQLPSFYRMNRSGEEMKEGGEDA